MLKFFLLIFLFSFSELYGQWINKFEIGLTAGIAETKKHHIYRDKISIEDPLFHQKKKNAYSVGLDFNFNLSNTIKIGTGLSFYERNYFLSSYQHHFNEFLGKINVYVDQINKINTLVIPFRFINYFKLGNKFSMAYSIGLLYKIYERDNVKVKRYGTITQMISGSVSTFEHEYSNSFFLEKNFNIEEELSLLFFYQLDKHFLLSANINTIFIINDYSFYFKKEKELFYNSYYGLNLGLIYKFNKKIKA